MKRLAILIAIAAMLSAAGIETASAQTRAVKIANITGSMVGKATYCGVPDKRVFSRGWARD